MNNTEKEEQKAQQIPMHLERIFGRALCLVDEEELGGLGDGIVEPAVP
jgi:hypothetical protein